MQELVIPYYKCLKCSKLVNYDKCKDYDCSSTACPANTFRIIINKVKPDVTKLSVMFVEALFNKNIKQLKNIIEEVDSNCSSEEIYDFFENLRSYGIINKEASIEEEEVF